MKLIVMDPEFVKLQLQKPKAVPPPCITFRKNMICINKSLAEALDLKEDSEVILIQDADRPKDFYLVKQAGGFCIKGTTKGELRINCAYFWQKIKELFKPEGESIKFKVATTPSKLNDLEGYAILTVDPLPSQRQTKGKKAELFDATAFAQASNL
jgi:hypothetical protein